MSTKALELRKERHALSIRMGQELEKNSAAGLATWKTLDGAQELLRQRIEATEASENLNTELSQVRNADRPGFAGPGEEGRTLTPNQEARSTPGYKREFDAWLRNKGEGPEMRAIGAAAGADGATLVPQGFEAELEVKMKYWGGVSNIARTIKTATGNPLPWPTMDDTSNTGEWLAEAAPTTSADPTFSNVTLGANLLSSKLVKVSVQLEQDSAFDIASMLSDAFAERLGRAQDTAYWVGDGVTIPVTGLLTALIAAGGRGVEAIGANNNSGNSADTDLTSIGTDDLSALINQLDRAYQKPTNKFIFNQSTQNKLRMLKDKYGRPVWATSIAGSEPDTIYGFGYQIDNAVAGIGAGNVTVGFGDFSKYIIRNVLGFTLVRFNELYMGNYQRGYQAFMRTDAKLLQANAFSYLFTSLS
jgi:HK97 family phage major capsid protein